MSITKEQAGPHANRPELLDLIWTGLQRFLLALAAAKFRLPMKVSLKDADGDLVREFTVVPGSLQVVPGRTDDAERAYVLPLVATAKDSTGRTAVLKLDAQAIEEVKFVN